MEPFSKDCPEEVTEQVKWPRTRKYSCTISEPPCISDKMDLLQRCCSENETWDPAPDCFLIQETINNPCPHVQKSATTAVFSSSETQHSDVLPIWVPVIREVGVYGLGPFRWVEPTSSFKSEFEPNEEYFLDDYHDDKNCMINNSYNRFEAVLCNETYNAICAYENLSDRKKSFCSQSYGPEEVCKQSDYSTRSKCFCLGGQEHNAVGAELLLPYQNLVYKSFTNDTCYMGLGKKENSYIWSNSSLSIDYTNWAKDTVFGEEYIYGGMSAEGWTLRKSQEELNCILYQKEAIVGNGELILRYDNDSGLFTLHLNNSETWVRTLENTHPLVFCFTDTSAITILERINIGDSYEEETGTFSFKPLSDAPGNYWCQGFVYPDVEVKESNEYFLRGYTEEYVMILSTNYTKGTNPLSEIKQEYLQEEFCLNLQWSSSSLAENFLPRIFKIFQVDKEHSSIVINFHLTAREDFAPLTHFAALRELGQRGFQNFSFVNLLVADTCIGVQTSHNGQAFTWPPTGLDEVAARPREGWCIDDDGAVINRKCQGNFVDGARWAEFEGQCRIVDSSEITPNLTHILNMNTPNEYIYQVLELSQDYKILKDNDINLLSKFIMQTSNLTSTDMNAMVNIINNIENVPAGILEDSQSTLQATDRILHYVDKLVNDSNFRDSIHGSNFSVISCDLKADGCDSFLSERGIIIHSLSSPNPNNFNTDDDFVFAIVPNEHSFELSDPNTSITMIVTIFENSRFFHDPSTQTINTVLSIHIPGFDTSEDAVTIYAKAPTESLSECSNWKYELEKTDGYWDHRGQTVANKSEYICQFSSLRYFSLVSAPNITSELVNISESHVEDKLSRVSELLKLYRRFFKPQDILLVSNLLYRVEKVQELELHAVASIIDDIIDIDRNILYEAGLKFNTSGGVFLEHLDRILDGCESVEKIARRNFFTLIFEMNHTNAIGSKLIL
ncbi:hypothetical protein JTB14_008925 [Gonioctena quinquepunctata]|nr:hypothetical protein JTB14_008925 [Gonioctena quinquepunctata]